MYDKGGTQPGVLGPDAHTEVCWGPSFNPPSGGTVRHQGRKQAAPHSRSPSFRLVLFFLPLLGQGLPCVSSYVSGSNWDGGPRRGTELLSSMLPSAFLSDFPALQFASRGQ